MANVARAEPLAGQEKLIVYVIPPPEQNSVVEWQNVNSVRAAFVPNGINQIGENRRMHFNQRNLLAKIGICENGDARMACFNKIFRRPAYSMCFEGDLSQAHVFLQNQLPNTLANPNLFVLIPHIDEAKFHNNQHFGYKCMQKIGNTFHLVDPPETATQFIMLLYKSLDVEAEGEHVATEFAKVFGRFDL
ncbi:hypothetical protein Ddc_10390 [Ditylenchus destructor]|nr:hypothetical protein Ddc_10390 [Ditylenchus destructor]